MKHSRYNYYIPYENGTIFMNGITEASFLAPPEYADTFRAIIENPDENTQFEAFINKLKQQGFILDDSVNEDEVIANKYEYERYPWEYRIMILPTYQCNLRCWYCVQDHKNSWLTDDMIDRIKKLVTQKLANPEIKIFHISWFGGEPLMAYDKLLEFTKFAQKLTSENGQTFVCSITTNATLLNPERIDELHKAGVTHYQITIDGEKDTHDSIKVLANKSAFEIALSNIAYLARHTTCTLRFNYTADNLKPEVIIKQLDERLPQEIRANINFNLQKVWQEDETAIDDNEVVKLMKMSSNIGIQPTLQPGGLCYVDHKHYDCVYPNGSVGKCENGIKGMRHGSILEDGSIDRSMADTKHYRPAFEADDSECKSCKYLPLCWGPCSQRRYQQLQQGDSIHCTWDNKDQQLSEIIINKYLTDKYAATKCE